MRLQRRFQSLARAYSPHEEQDLGSYAALTALFSAGFGASLAWAARRGELPEGFSVGDVLLVATATHKLSRVLARGRVTSFLRAPFTSYDGPGDINEINESPRGSGLQRTVGELVGCPLCIGTWVAAGLVNGLVHVPRSTRAVAATFSSLAVADFLHIAYTAGASRSE